MTDVNGYAQLTVTSGASDITISCVGYQTKTNTAAVFNAMKRVTLEDDTKAGGNPKTVQKKKCPGGKY